MKLNAKVDSLTKEVARGNSSSETKQLLLWLLELQVYREQLDEQDAIFSVTTKDDGYIVDANCNTEDLLNILGITALEIGKTCKDSENPQDIMQSLETILGQNFKEGYENSLTKNLN